MAWGSSIIHTSTSVLGENRNGSSDVQYTVTWEEQNDASAGKSRVRVTAIDFEIPSDYGVAYIYGNLAFNGTNSFYLPQAENGVYSINSTLSWTVYRDGSTDISSYMTWVEIPHSNGLANVTLSGSLGYASSDARPYDCYGVSIDVTTALTSFLYLTLSAGDKTSLAVYRGSTALSSGALLTKGESLKVQFSGPTGYEVTCTVSGVGELSSGDSFTVTSSHTVSTTATENGFVYIDNGTELKAYLIYIDTGTLWKRYKAYVDNGTSYKSY